MITSLKLKGKHNVGMNTSGCINVDDTKVALKEIPFVRYDFEQYGVEECEYIKKSMEKFNLSTHLIQYKAYNGRLPEDLQATMEIKDKVAKYLYFTLNQEEMQMGKVSDSQVGVAMMVKQSVAFDRYMIIDNTRDMSLVVAKQIIKSLAKQLGVRETSIGICNSPLCMNDNLACLTAVTAREIAAIYSTNDIVATPSANHQCMNCCGCMRFYEITSDIEAPADTKTKSSGDKKEKTDKEPRQASSTPKKQKITTLSRFI